MHRSTGERKYRHQGDGQSQYQCFCMFDTFTTTRALWIKLNNKASFRTFTPTSGFHSWLQGFESQAWWVKVPTWLQTQCPTRTHTHRLQVVRERLSTLIKSQKVSQNQKGQRKQIYEEQIREMMWHTVKRQTSCSTWAEICKDTGSSSFAQLMRF